jgi:nucleotide-binding universal stress UspA family protein
MQQHILLPTDFSDNSWNALIYALKLYANKSCTFYFLHTTHISNATSRSYITTKFVDDLQKESLKNLTELKLQALFVNDNANHDFEIISSEEELKNAIHKVIEEHNIDIVIMGTKGASNAIENFMGSNTVHVLKKIKDCPVLLIPEELEFVIPKQIAFPTDYNRFYEKSALESISAIANLFDSMIRVLHINTEKKLSITQEFNKKILADYLENNRHSFHWESDYTDKSTTISTFIDENKIELLAMVNYKHSLLETILNEPVIKKLAFNPTVPLLIIPE